MLDKIVRHNEYKVTLYFTQRPPLIVADSFGDALNLALWLINSETWADNGISFNGPVKRSQCFEDTQIIA